MIRSWKYNIYTIEKNIRKTTIFISKTVEYSWWKFEVLLGLKKYTECIQKKLKSWDCASWSGQLSTHTTLMIKKQRLPKIGWEI